MKKKLTAYAAIFLFVAAYCQANAQSANFVNDSAIQLLKNKKYSLTIRECFEKATSKKPAACKETSITAGITGRIIFTSITEKYLRQENYWSQYSKIADITLLNLLDPKIEEIEYKDENMVVQKYCMLKLNTYSGSPSVKLTSESSSFPKETKHLQNITFYFTSKEQANTVLQFLKSLLVPEAPPKPVLPLSIYVDDGSKYGLKDAKGSIVINALYDYMFQNNAGYFEVQLGEKRGTLDENGKEKIPVKYDQLTKVNEGIMAVRLDGKAGYIDPSGKTVIPFKYDATGSFEKGMAVVTFNGKSGVINKEDSVLIPFDFDDIYFCEDSLFSFKKGDKWGLITSSNKIILPATFEQINTLDGFPALVAVNNKYGFINKKGKLIIKPQYEYVTRFINGYAGVGFNKKKGIIDSTGKVIGSIKYDRTGFDEYAGFSSNRCKVIIGCKRIQYTIDWEGGKSGFIDKTGKEIIPLVYDEATNFSEGLAAIKLKDKWGFIDPSGKVAIPIQYERITIFNDGKAKVTKDGNTFYIDKTGKKVE